MKEDESEEKLLRSVALQNAQAVFLARERAERELRESNERATNILESISDAFIALDQEWRFTYVNPRAEQIYEPLKKTRASLLGKNYWTEFPDVIGTPAESHLRRTMAEKTKVEFEEFYPPLNSWFHVRLYPARDGLSIYFLDITTRKAAEMASRDSEERFRALADSIPQLAWMANPDGHIFWYNRRWYEYTGTTPEQMEGWGWRSVHDPDILPQVMERWVESIHTGTPFEMEFPLRGVDGAFRWFLTRGSPFRDANGKVTRWFGTNTNIDEQRRLLQSLGEARDHLEKRVEERTRELKAANDSLRGLSAGLLKVQDDERRRLARELHDSVGQILAALSMNIGIVQLQAHNLTPDAARAVAQNAQLVQQASSEIRTLSHLLHPPLLEIAGLASTLRWFVDGFSERSKIKVDVEIPANFRRLPNDIELTIFRIVQECLTNIHRHSGSTTAAIQIQQDGNELTVRVQDNGKGISLEKQLELIESGRSGVGFRGMRERLRQLGGTLEIQSEGSGTVVTATLLVNEDQSADEAAGGFKPELDVPSEQPL